jgi:hypothetical protein
MLVSAERRRNEIVVPAGLLGVTRNEVRVLQKGAVLKKAASVRTRSEIVVPARALEVTRSEVRVLRKSRAVVSRAASVKKRRKQTPRRSPKDARMMTMMTRMVVAPMSQ